MPHDGRARARRIVQFPRLCFAIERTLRGELCDARASSDALHPQSGPGLRFSSKYVTRARACDFIGLVTLCDSRTVPCNSGEVLH
jgi:hypothetical protein